MAEGDMIWMNNDLQTTDIITIPMQHIPVLCIQCIAPGEDIPLPGLGVEALNKVILPLPRYLHPKAHHHLPTPPQWGVNHPPQVKEVIP